MSKKVSKREVIIDGAIRLFADKGLKGASTAELSAMTGIAEGTIFYYFKSKEDILLHALARIKDEILVEFEEYQGLQAPGSGLEQVKQAIDFFLFLAAKLEDRFLLLHHRFLYELAEVNATCRQHLQEIYDGLVNIFEKALATGQEDGSVISSASTHKSAMLLLAMVDGLVRFKSYNLYDVGALLPEFMTAAQRMFASHGIEGQGAAG